MKIIVLKSPKFLSPLLRKIFGGKKRKNSRTEPTQTHLSAK
ncbi:MAG: stage V sporulation protein SpoVM [Eubacteriales bacterium]|nr:stage V sporulation protein SpoVM [Eubacteriales bacterium]